MVWELGKEQTLQERTSSQVFCSIIGNMALDPSMVVDVPEILQERYPGDPQGRAAKQGVQEGLAVAWLFSKGHGPVVKHNLISVAEQYNTFEHSLALGLRQNTDQMRLFSPLFHCHDLVSGKEKTEKTL